MADKIGRVLVVSCSALLTSLEAIKRINGSDELPDPVKTTPHLDCYPWMIKNKYFVVKVHLCHGGSYDFNLLLKETSHLHFEGIIIIFDQEKKETLRSATDCMKILQSHEASVQLLLNAGKDDVSTSNQGLSKTEVLEWCLKYSFELVELNPNDDDEQEAGEFGEQTGFTRVIQALNCGEWPNIELKAGIKNENAHGKKMVDEMSKTDEVKHSAQSNPSQENESKTDEGSAQKCSGLTDDESELLRRLGQEEPEEESFEDLFMKLRDMKDHAATLPHDERKSYAEQVAVAFWKAMGGDDEEISGLDSD